MDIEHGGGTPAGDAPAPHVFTARQVIDRIDRWFVAEFHGAPAMRDTDAFNHVRGAVDELKKQFAEEQ
jgi:hypothetical protein